MDFQKVILQQLLRIKPNVSRKEVRYVLILPALLSHLTLNLAIVCFLWGDVGRATRSGKR